MLNVTVLLIEAENRPLKSETTTEESQEKPAVSL